MSVQTTIPPPPVRRQALAPAGLVSILFLFSGASSLIFETLFTRLLSYTFGNTAYAASTVLAAFLGGLALGAYLIGRIADRYRPSLLMYGALELAIGIYGLCVPALFAGLTRVYVVLFHWTNPGEMSGTAMRFVLAAIVITVPSALMGGTLPVLARAIASVRPDYHASLTKFYAVNTSGAAIGTLAATYFLMPNWGVRGAIGTAFVVNTCIFLCTFTLRRFGLDLRQLEPLDEPTFSRCIPVELHDLDPDYDDELSSWTGRKAQRVILSAAFVAGLVTLSYEVIWTHALAFLVGNAVYAFGMMLFAFLCGLAIGAHAVSRLEPNRRIWAWAFAVSQVGAGLGVVLTLPLWNLVPDLFQLGIQTARILSLTAVGVPLALRLIWIGLTGLRSKWKEAAIEISFLALLGCVGALPMRSGLSFFVATETFRFFVAFYLLIVPVVLLGVSFPCLLNLFTRTRTHTGQRVGSIYAVNTLGSILGSLLAGFVLLPLLGSHATLSLAASLNAAVGAAFFFVVIRGKPSAKMAFAVTCAMVALAAVVHPLRWDLKKLSRGSYVYFRKGLDSDKLLYAREDVQGGLTSVVQTGKTRTMLTNAKFQGNDTGEIPAQARFTLIPTLFTRNFDRALVIGLGTGGSLHTVALFPFRRIDVVELAPSVVEAARNWFGHVNGNALDQDPRVHLSIADGRNHLLVRQDRYDLITIEVTSIWISGEADLYNEQFYQLCRSHMTDKGVLQQWVQIHHMRPQDFYVTLNTAAQVFPHVAFFLGPSQGLLIASSSPLDVDYRLVQGWDNLPSVRHELDRAGVHNMFSLLGEVVLYDESYRAATSDFLKSAGMPLDFASTDAYPYLEYQTPKGNVLPPEQVIDSYFFSRLRPPSLPPDLTVGNLPEPQYRDYIAALALEDRGEYLAAASRFDRIDGRLRVCAQSELDWIRLVRQRLPGDPMPPFSDCRFDD